jgi:ribA/ribD-fused uncharacterized protein
MLTTNKHVFFFSNEDVFSNFYLCHFSSFGKNFNCTEQYFMWSKAFFFEDFETTGLILKEKVPYNQKKLGRLVKNYDDSLWSKEREHFMYQANRLKYLQNEGLLKILLDTYPKQLVEASKFDKIWGIGLAENNPMIHDESNWKGMNLLGKVLTKLRNDILNSKVE